MRIGKARYIMYVCLCVVFRQVDDLQFQLEEQHVISGDQLETVAESSTNQLTVISRQLEDEKKANVQLQEQIKVPRGTPTRVGRRSCLKIEWVWLQCFIAGGEG